MRNFRVKEKRGAIDHMPSGGLAEPGPLTPDPPLPSIWLEEAMVSDNKPTRFQAGQGLGGKNSLINIGFSSLSSLISEFRRKLTEHVPVTVMATEVSALALRALVKRVC